MDMPSLKILEAEKLAKLPPTDKRMSEEHKERLRKHGFQKGMKKVPGSGLKAIPQEVKVALAERTFDAVATLVDVMENSKNDNARVKAAAYFLDPFISKAPQEVTVQHTHSIADLLAQVNQARLNDERNARKIIDIIPEPDRETPALRVTPLGGGE